MNWKLFLLSLFGLVMGHVTVYRFPTKLEPLAWLPILVLSAYLIARYAGQRYFVHGFLIGLLNGIFVTFVHVRLSAMYLANHPLEAAQYMKMHTESGASIEQCILFTNSFTGLIAAVVLGSFSKMLAGYFQKTGG